MKHSLGKLTTIVLGICFLVSCSSDNESNWESEEDVIERTYEVSKGIALSRAEQDVANGQTRLGLSFFQKYCEAKPNENFICAPFSLSNVLAMLANGATPEVIKEINEVYGLAAGDLENINSLHSKLLKELPAIDSKSKFASANLVTLNPGIDFDAKFKQTVCNIFGAETLNLDLSTNQGVSQFNSWCYDKTNGMIQKMLDGPVQSIFSVSSADYFNAKWRIPFDKKNTAIMPFYNANGNEGHVATMSNLSTADIYSNGELSVVQLYYGNKAFRFSIILPGSYSSDNGISLSETIATLTPEKWMEINQNTFEWEYILYLPKFEQDTSGSIASIVKNLGLDTLFYSGSLNGIASNSDNLTLGAVLQSVKISVTENGTRAVSVTTGIMAGSPGYTEKPEEIHVDRPFAFIIDETSTGAILYAGVIRNL